VNQLNQPWAYIVLFGLVFIVYAKIIPRRNVSKSHQNPTIHEIEETMEHFTAELDEQNKALIQLLAETKRDNEMQSTKLSSRVETLEKQLGQAAHDLSKLGFTYEELQKKVEQNPKISLNSVSELQVQHPPINITKDDVEGQPFVAMNIKTRYYELFELYEQGKSTEYIAKKLNMNKGEVNLIFQLAKQEERLNAQ
jgi:predicted nuclease with TOPRIM domain